MVFCLPLHSPVFRVLMSVQALEVFQTQYEEEFEDTQGMLFYPPPPSFSICIYMYIFLFPFPTAFC